MAVFVITDGRENYIRQDKATEKYVPIKNFKYATKWTNGEKANKILNSNVSKEIRENYKVKQIDVEECIEKKALETSMDICARDIVDDNVSDWVLKINSVSEILSNFNARRQELSEKLSNIDKEIIDIEHYIEFGKYNAYQGWVCFKMLQTCLRQRRKYKDELRVMELIGNNHLDNDSISSLSKKIANVKNKIYTPRALPELFKYT